MIAAFCISARHTVAVYRLVAPAVGRTTASGRGWPCWLAFLPLWLGLAAFSPPALQAFDLALGASASAPSVNAGNNFTFVLNVTNHGPEAATAVVLTNLLSFRSTFLSATTTQGSCTNENGQVICAAGNLAPTDHFSVTLTVRAAPGTNLCVSGVAAAGTDPAPDNNLARASTVGTRTLAPLANGDTIFFDEIVPGPGSVYPSIIFVSGLTAQVHKVTVTLNTVAHVNPDDLDILLVAPDGQNVMLMSDCGFDNAFTDLTLTLDDDAAVALPDTDPPIVTGTYRPSNFGSVVLETMEPPAPPRPYGATLAALQGGNPNGMWRLFALDDSPEDGGYIAEGWTLQLVTSEPIADLSLVSAANVGTLPVGSNLTYTLTVTNRGPANTTATLLDVLPPSATFVSAVPTQGSCQHTAGVVTCQLGQLPSGAFARVTLVVAPTVGGVLTNLAQVSGAMHDHAPTNNAASLATTVLPASDLTLAATAPATAFLRTPVITTFVLTNRGPNAATTVGFTNSLPAGMSFLSAAASQGACTHSAGVVTCVLGALAPNTGAIISIEGRPQSLGANTHSARVTSPELDLVPDNNSAQAITEILPIADLQLTAGPAFATLLLGQDWTHTLFLTNHGPSAATATVTSLLPALVQFVSATPSQGSCTHTGGLLVCDFGALDTNHLATLTLVTRPTILGSVTNRFTLVSSLPDSAPSNNLASASAVVVSNADLALRVTPAALAPVWLGEDAAYTFTISNRGPSVATSVALTNTLPVSINFVSATPEHGSCQVTGKTVICQFGALGASNSVSVAMVTRPTVPGLFLISARASATEGDSDPSNNVVAPALQVLAASSPFVAQPVAIPEIGPALAYPSTLQVSGLTAAVYRVRVALTNLAHTYPDDLDILLVGPGGQAALLLSDAGGDVAVTNLNLVLDEDVSTRLADAGPLASGLFHPTDYEATDAFPAPAPAGPYGTDFSVFHDINPNGTWSLYLLDDAAKDAGSLGGWSLTLATVNPIADVQLVQHVPANPAAVGSNFLITLLLTNHGPASATDVRLTQSLHPALNFLSAVASQGSCTNAGEALHCALGTLPLGAHASILVTCLPTNAAAFTQTVFTVAAERDLVPANHAAATFVELEFPPVITLQPLSQTVTNGDPVTFTAEATGTGPLSFQWQRNGLNVPGATSLSFHLDSATPNNSGSYRLRATNRVGVALSDPAVLRVLGPPTVSDLPDRVISEDSTTGPIAFTIEDAESPPGLISVAGGSSDTHLVSLADIVFGGGGSNRTVQVTPRPNAVGQAVISVIATDPHLQSTTNSFLLTVSQVNDPPSLSILTNRATVEDTPIVISFLADDLETSPDNLVYSLQSSDPTLVPTNQLAFAGTGPARTLTLTPGTNRHGSTTLTLFATDPSNSVATSSFVLTVDPVNDPPALEAIEDRSIAEDSGPQVVTLQGLGPGAPNESQFLQLHARSDNPGLIPDPLLLHTNPAATAQLTFTPATNASGTAQITVTVTDGNSTNAVTTRVFMVQVIPVNDPPAVSLPAAVALEEDAAISIPIVLSDPDDDVSTATLTAFSSNPALVASASLQTNGAGAFRSLSLAPQTNATGAAVISVVATDSHGAAATNTFALSVAPVNDPPTLNLITDRTVAEDAPSQSVPLAGISAGAPNESQSLTITAASSNPALIPNPSVAYTSPAATGTLTFQPNSNATGSALLTVSLSDGSSQFARSFTVTVTPANDAPSITAIPAQATPEDTMLATAFSVGDPETPAPLLSLSAASSNPALIAAADISFDGAASNRLLLLTPRPNQNGTADITLFVSDGTATNSATFPFTVDAVNDAPTLNPIATFVTNTASGNPAFVVPINGISSGAGNESQSLSITATSSNPGLMPNPTVSYSSPNTNGTLTLRPGNNDIGTTLITVTVDDGSASNNTAVRTFIANIKSAVNVLPTLSTITNRATLEDTPTPALPFTVRDSQTPAASLTVFASSSNPGLLPTNNIALGGAGTNRTVTLTPALNQTGLVAITLTVLDDAFGSSNMTFTLTVNPSNDAPAISAITNRVTSEDAPVTVPFTIGDVDAPAGSLLLSASSANTTLVPNANLVFGGAGTNRSLFVTPATNQSGTAAITVRVTDGLATNSAAFTLTVNAVNDPPSITSIAPVTTAEDTSVGPLNFTVGDVETAAGTLAVTVGTSNPLLIAPADITLGGAGANRTLAFTPRPNAHGAATLTLTVTDAGGASNNTSVAVTVSPLNDPPALDVIANVTVNQNAGPQSVPLTGIHPGPPNENQILSVSATSSTNLLSLLSVDYPGTGSNGTLYYQPAPGATGTVQVTVTVDDGQPTNHLASRAFTITINAAPRIAYLPDQATLQNVPTAAILIDLSDAESPAGALTLAVTSSSPLVQPTGIALGGSGAQRTLVLTPASNQVGTVLISVTAFDPVGASGTRSFNLTVSVPNVPPALDPIPDRLVNPASGPLLVPLTGIGPGGSNEPDIVTLTAWSSDPAHVAVLGIQHSPGDSTASLTLLPAGTNGSARITVTADDGQSNHRFTTREFTVSLNTPPFISSVADLSIPDNTSTPVISVTVGDAESAPQQLTLFTTVNNPLVPPGSVVFGGSGSNRTIVVTPAPGHFGSTPITIIVADAQGLSASATFLLTVTHDNVPPSLDVLSNVVVNPGSGPFLVQLSGIGPGVSNETDLVTLSAESSDTNLFSIVELDYTPGASTAVLSILPVGTVGSAVIQVAAHDGQATSNLTVRTFTAFLNTPPTLSLLTNQSTLEDTPTAPQSFTIQDAESPADALLLAGENAPSFVPAVIQFAGAGNNRAVSVLGQTNASGLARLTVVVTDPQGLSASNTFEVLIEPVSDPIQILEQPQSVEAAFGETVSFHVVAVSGLPLSYQWRQEAMDLPGATNASLLLASAHQAEAGAYTVLVRNGDGTSELSQPATLSFHGRPRITSVQFTNSHALVFFLTLAGSTNTLEFTTPVTDTNWIPLSGALATNELMMLPDAEATNAFRFYRIRRD